ncbi:MAG: hypothetical protein IPL55_22795 [Saprospiraceae bacterium]|nr:hypothetical protein [Saprospiraceae bacterium]
MSSNHGEIERIFVQKIIKENIARIGSNSSEGVLKSDFSNPATGLFNFAKYCITDHDLNDAEDVELNLFHFTNFGASPEIQIHSFLHNSLIFIELY